MAQPDLSLTAALPSADRRPTRRADDPAPARLDDPRRGNSSFAHHAALLAEALEASDEIVILSGHDGRIIYANQSARLRCNLADGRSAADAFRSVMTPASFDLLQRDILAVLTHRRVWTGELEFVNRAGLAFPVAVTLQRHTSDDSDPEVLSAIALDISALKIAQELLEHQATHDPLTGLPNRTLFQELGEQALARADREGTTIAVLFLDLDRFKPVNDSLGHAAGDQLLVQVASRLRASLRRGDGVARFGGDEFVAVCEHPAGQIEMVELAKRIITAISEPVRLDEVTARVGASIGIAIGAGGRVTIDTLIRDADAALYQAKERGRGRAVLFGAPDDA